MMMVTKGRLSHCESGKLWETNLGAGVVSQGSATVHNKPHVDNWKSSHTPLLSQLRHSLELMLMWSTRPKVINSAQKNTEGFDDNLLNFQSVGGRSHLATLQTGTSWPCGSTRPWVFWSLPSWEADPAKQSRGLPSWTTKARTGDLYQWLWPGRIRYIYKVFVHTLVGWTAWFVLFSFSFLNSGQSSF